MHAKKSPPNVESQRKNGILGSELQRFVSYYLAHVGAAVLLKRKEKGGEKKL
jgi:hypothetical protein